MYDIILGKRSSQVMLCAPGDPAAGDGAQGRAQSLALEDQLRQGTGRGHLGQRRAAGADALQHPTCRPTPIQGGQTAPAICTRARVSLPVSLKQKATKHNPQC